MVSMAKGDEDSHPMTRDLFYHGPYLITTDGYRVHIVNMPEEDRPAAAVPLPDKLAESVKGFTDGLEREGKVSIAVSATFLKQAILSTADVVILSIPLDPAAKPTNGPALEVFSLIAPGGYAEEVTYALIKALAYGPDRFRNLRPRIEIS